MFKILFLKNNAVFSYLYNSKYPLIITKRLTPIEITAYPPIQTFIPYCLFNVCKSTIKINAKILIISIAINFKTPNLCNNHSLKLHFPILPSNYQ